MNVTSVKRAFALAATTVGTGGAMMLAPAMANAATAHPAHVQAVSNVSKASWPFPGYMGDYQGNYGQNYQGSYGQDNQKDSDEENSFLEDVLGDLL
jgi:hypothetical protein